jgi:general secretion pathway protein H
MNVVGRSAGRQHGFTLMEVLVVLAILALGVMLVAPSLNRVRQGMMVRTEAYELATHLRSARAAARATNIEHVLVFDLVGHRYWADGVVRPRQLPRTIAIDLTVPQSEHTGASAGRVRFLPDGSTSGARVILRDKRSSASISVDWLSGDVRLQLW